MGVDEPLPLEELALGVRNRGVARPEVRGRHPSLGEERHVGPAELRTDLETVAGDQRLDQRIAETRARGGTLMQPPLKEGGKPTEWIQWRAWKRHYPYPLLVAVLESAPLGLSPKPLVTDNGVMVLEVLERRE